MLIVDFEDLISVQSTAGTPFRALVVALMSEGDVSPPIFTAIHVSAVREALDSANTATGQADKESVFGSAPVIVPDGIEFVISNARDPGQLVPWINAFNESLDLGGIAAMLRGRTHP